MKKIIFYLLLPAIAAFTLYAKFKNSSQPGIVANDASQPGAITEAQKVILGLQPPPLEIHYAADINNDVILNPPALGDGTPIIKGQLDTPILWQNNQPTKYTNMLNGMTS